LQVLTVNHKAGGTVRLDATITYKDTGHEVRTPSPVFFFGFLFWILFLGFLLRPSLGTCSPFPFCIISCLARGANAAAPALFLGVLLW
jgi:hypothetical protein